MKLQVLGDRVLIEPLVEERKTPSGIIIPETAKQERPTKGKVVGHGEGAYNNITGKIMPLRVKIGDTVLYGKFGGEEIQLEGKTYLLLGEGDLHGILIE